MAASSLSCPRISIVLKDADVDVDADADADANEDDDVDALEFVLGSVVAMAPPSSSSAS